MNLLTSRNLSLLFGVVFAAVGVIGFVPNPLVSEHGIFEVNTAHNLVHLVTGLALLAGVFLLQGKEGLILKIFGAVYALVAVLGFVLPGTEILGLIHVNDADRYLHVLLAAAMLGGAFLAKD